VSSFGLGGTNAHVIVEQPAAPPARGAAPPAVVLAVSARTPDALRAAVSYLRTHLVTVEDADGWLLADVAHTLAGRTAFEHRAAVLASDLPGAVAALDTWLADPAGAGGEGDAGDAGEVGDADGAVERAGAHERDTRQVGGAENQPDVTLMRGAWAGLSGGPAPAGALSDAASDTVVVDEQPVELRAAAEAWVAGGELAYEVDGARRVWLPPYPFQRSRHWVDAP
jgi:acyl transferase domain-containing protein